MMKASFTIYVKRYFLYDWVMLVSIPREAIIKYFVVRHANTLDRTVVSRELFTKMSFMKCKRIDSVEKESKAC